MRRNDGMSLVDAGRWEAAIYMNLWKYMLRGIRAFFFILEFLEGRESDRLHDIAVKTGSDEKELFRQAERTYHPPFIFRGLCCLGIGEVEDGGKLLAYLLQNPEILSEGERIWEKRFFPADVSMEVMKRVRAPGTLSFHNSR